MPEPRYRARRESQPRSGTRTRPRTRIPHGEGARAYARTRPQTRDRGRRHRRSRPPLALLAFLLVVALAGVSAAAFAMRASADSPQAKATGASPDARCRSCHADLPAGTTFSHDAHPPIRDCGACHAAPKPSHYRAECAACHSPARPFSKPKLTHPVFGAHTVATHSCDACHRQEAKAAEKPAPTPSCRSCHRNTCGKGVTSMAGCLKCHQKGTTDSWVGNGR